MSLHSEESAGSAEWLYELPVDVATVLVVMTGLIRPGEVLHEIEGNVLC